MASGGAQWDTAPAGRTPGRAGQTSAMPPAGADRRPPGVYVCACVMCMQYVRMCGSGHDEFNVEQVSETGSRPQFPMYAVCFVPDWFLSQTRLFKGSSIM